MSNPKDNPPHEIAGMSDAEGVHVAMGLADTDAEADPVGVA